MHYFKDAPSDNELILNNLRLLYYDLKEANTTFRLNIDQLTIENMKAHPKLQISIIHFIVSKLADDQSFLQQFNSIYPPRSQVEQSLYKQEIAKYLKNTNKIPKNFVITKVMLDQRIFSFIRYVSEFALRAQFLASFPSKKLLTFYLDPMRLFYEDRPCVNEINDMFQVSNYQFENLNNLTIPIQIIKLLTGLCGHQILIQIKKLKKQLKKNCSFIDSIKLTIDSVSESLKFERDKSLKLIQQLQLFKNQINPQYLSKERKLDRKPQLDASYRVFNGISNIIRQYRELQMDHNMNQIQSTIRLDKFCDENNLNQLQQKHNNNVTNLLNNIQKIEKESWVRDRGIKCRQISHDSLNKIKQLKLQLQTSQ